MVAARDIDALLPQTQCQRCGYDGCMAYAEAIAAGAADINRCPPGGTQTTRRLAELIGKPERPIADECGTAWPPKVAFIREAECIGCTRCIQACPVDAIVGAAKQMHTVIDAQCTGCELCLPVCPVDCIDMPEAEPGTGQPVWPAASAVDAERAADARQNFQTRARRQHQNRRAPRSSPTETAQKRDTIAAAMERARAKRAQHE